MTSPSAYLIRRSSMQPITKIRLFRIRLAVLILAVYWFAIFTGTHLPSSSAPSIGAEVNDKTKHLVAFFGLGLLLCYVTTSPPSLRRFGAVAAIAIGYGVIDELTQLFVPGRHADPHDVLADAAGALAAITLYAIGSLLAHRLFANFEPVRSQHE